jgi:hypothetical protein
MNPNLKDNQQTIFPNTVLDAGTFTAPPRQKSFESTFS